MISILHQSSRRKWNNGAGTPSLASEATWRAETLRAEKTFPANEYYKLAADQDYPDAQYRYGCCLEDGLGVGIDLKSPAELKLIFTKLRHIANSQRIKILLLPNVNMVSVLNTGSVLEST
jgi:hypothetical protein